MTTLVLDGGDCCRNDGPPAFFNTIKPVGIMRRVGLSNTLIVTAPLVPKFVPHLVHRGPSLYRRSCGGDISTIGLPLDLIAVKCLPNFYTYSDPTIPRPDHMEAFNDR